MRILAMLSAFVLTLALGAVSAAPGQIDYLKPKLMSELVPAQLGPVQSGRRIPMITWGADIATLLGAQQGIFKDEGLDVELFVENDFVKQVQGVIKGETPYLRGTLDMLAAASEALAKAGTELVVIVQLSWSNGGDTMTARSHVKSPKEVKSLVLQLYGPHTYYAATVLKSAGKRLADVDFRWTREITLPKYDTGGKIVDGPSAFAADPSADAVMAITPDAVNLTSAEWGVKDSRILLSTKSAPRVIADVYGVRKDYFTAHPEEVKKFVHAELRAQEALRDLIADKDRRQGEYQKLLAIAAESLLDAPQATNDAEAMLADAELVGYDGNVKFFTQQGTTRHFTMLTSEIESAFIEMGLLAGKAKLTPANWNWPELARGLKYAQAAAPKAPALDSGRVEAKVEQMIDVEPSAWANEGVLFESEITFQPNQNSFPVSQYEKTFREALETYEKFAGALFAIEGHTDPLGIRKLQKEQAAPAVVAEKERQARNLSLQRARAVRQEFLDYARSRGVELDESFIVAVGMGVKTPKFDPPKNKEEWDANRRVVFRVKQVEAELNEFAPLK